MKRVNMSKFAEFKICNICGKTFFTKTGLKLHLDEVHQQPFPNEENEKKSTELEQTSILQSDNLEFNPSNNKINAIKDSTDFLLFLTMI